MFLTPTRDDSTFLPSCTFVPLVVHAFRCYRRLYESAPPLS